MTRTKLDDRVLPKYSKGEEITNMTSHIVGAAFGVVATILCIVFAAIHGNVYGVVSGTIYGITMIVLYTMSSIYHGLSPKLKGKKVMQVIDHCSIFLLIAGSYTPFALCTLRQNDPFTGWLIFAIIWGFAILGIVLNAIDLKKYKVFSMICYLAMGWCIIFKITILPELLTWNGFILLLSGGIVYTLGMIPFALLKGKKSAHFIWHLIVMAGVIIQFMGIYLCVY